MGEEFNPDDYSFTMNGQSITFEKDTEYKADFNWSKIHSNEMYDKEILEALVSKEDQR